MSVSIKLPATETLRLELSGSTLRIWLNRPDARNALSDEMVAEFCQVLDAVRDERALRSIVIRGEGGIFCAGGDIKGFKNVMQGTMQADEVAASNRSFGDFMLKVNEQPQVVIMLVEGAAIGGGLGLSCIGDVTIATRDARFRLSETSLGIPPAQIAPFVVERIGLTQARRLMLTGARFNGEQALGYGLAHAVASNGDDLEQQCGEVLEQISVCGAKANAITKSILFETTRRPRPDALDFASRGFAECMLGDEGREGIAAFVEKRSPAWSGKR
ncbi:MAG: enoyl-CoA hydratase/isomerase family protein [Pseudomonadales bacterium]|nr:MAG: enoyl-CoA hydratase/isomerase family protein [Pseudomonadales bacterium]